MKRNWIVLILLILLIGPIFAQTPQTTPSRDTVIGTHYTELSAIISCAFGSSWAGWSILPGVEVVFAPTEIDPDTAINFGLLARGCIGLNRPAGNPLEWGAVLHGVVHIGFTDTANAFLQKIDIYGGLGAGYTTEQSDTTTYRVVFPAIFGAHIFLTRFLTGFIEFNCFGGTSATIGISLVI